MPADKQATTETIDLFNKLFESDKTLFGKQAELLVGANHPRGTEGSDTFDMIGKYPALFGYDLGNLEQDKLKNFSVLPFTDIKEKTAIINAAGGVVTYNWRLDNPVVAGADAKGGIVMGNITTLFNDSGLLSNFNGWLDNMVTYFLNLGNIPVIFRPFHECNGSWFWWGNNGATADEFVRLYRYVVDYFKSKGVHNLLYAYCTGKFQSLEKFLERYPGDDYIDVLCFDAYDDDKNILSDDLTLLAQTVIAEAANRNKIAALAETGYINMPVANWFTNVLEPAISGLAYVMLWGNYGTPLGAYWSTWEGQAAADDFKTFAQNTDIEFLSSLGT